MALEGQASQTDPALTEATILEWFLDSVLVGDGDPCCFDDGAEEGHAVVSRMQPQMPDGMDDEEVVPTTYCLSLVAAGIVDDCGVLQWFRKPRARKNDTVVPRDETTPAVMACRVPEDDSQTSSVVAVDGPAVGVQATRSNLPTHRSRTKPSVANQAWLFACRCLRAGRYNASCRGVQVEATDAGATHSVVSTKSAALGKDETHRTERDEVACPELREAQEQLGLHKEVGRPLEQHMAADASIRRFAIEQGLPPYLIPSDCVVAWNHRPTPKGVELGVTLSGPRRRDIEVWTLNWRSSLSLLIPRRGEIADIKGMTVRGHEVQEVSVAATHVVCCEGIVTVTVQPFLLPAFPIRFSEQYFLHEANELSGRSESVAGVD